MARSCSPQINRPSASKWVPTDPGPNLCARTAHGFWMLHRQATGACIGPKVQVPNGPGPNLWAPNNPGPKFMGPTAQGPFHRPERLRALGFCTGRQPDHAKIRLGQGQGWTGPGHGRASKTYKITSAVCVFCWMLQHQLQMA